MIFHEPLRVFDHVMYCLPRGSGLRSIASAYTHNHRSFYDNTWCASLSAIMHELGHNMGLNHSGRGDTGSQSRYGDTSGYMGYSVSTIGGPAMCFNGHKHWYLQWYNNRRVELNGNRAWTGKLAPFTDYEETVEGEHVILMKIGNYFLQYNKAEKFNVGTDIFHDEITVTLLQENQVTRNMGSID